MTGLVISTLLLSPAAPVPNAAPPPPASAKLDAIQLAQFANLVENLANRIRDSYVRDTLTPRELLDGAVRGLYEEVGLPVPDTVKAAVARASTQIARLEVLRDVRSLLGNHPNLRGSRALFAATNGFRYATDPICHLTSPRASTYASIDQDFGVGIELEGVVGMQWAIYQVEHRVASGTIAPVGYFGPVPKRDEVASPAAFPWRVKRVVPGSPAQKSGVKPGDLITHLNGVEITVENVDKQFALFAMPRQMFDPQTGQALPQDRTITFRRGDEKSFTATLKAGLYNPESAFGVLRTTDDKWDCMLDRKVRIGYIRVGAIEMGLDTRFADMMSDLAKQGCRGLILDLRWCPGGYVDPGTRIAGLFLPDGSVISKMVFRNTERPNGSGDVVAPSGGGKYATLPLVVLVGHETTGGGELIASALRDNNRCVVIGQRTVGRATIQNLIDVGFGGVQFRVTTGTSLRPNGKNRQRSPESQPTDDWGIRPDDGQEVPITSGKAAELRHQADLHALRPAGSREALPFDDPAEDPFRLAALKYFRAKLGPAK